MIRIRRRRQRGWSLMCAAVATVAALAMGGCGSGARGAGASPPLRIDYPDFDLTSGSPIPVPDNAAPFYVATSALPTALMSARVWAWPAGPAPSREVKQLGTELGLVGDPFRVADGWEVSSSGAMLQVYDDPGWPWSYTTKKTPAGWADMTCAQDGIFGPYFTCNDNPPPPPPSPQGPTSPQPTIAAPGPDQAPAIAQPLLTSLGVTGPISVSDVGDDGTTTLDVPPSVQGMPTSGFRVWIQVGSTGVVAAAGRLASAMPGAAYPLISATQAFDLSNGWSGPACFAPAAPAAATSAPPAPTPGCQPPQSQNVTGALLGLELEWQDKQPILLPAWFFTVQGDSDSPVLGTVAIDRAYLQGPTRNSPSTTPTPPIPPTQSP